MQSSTATGLNNDALAAYDASERRRRAGILRKLTDKDFLLAPWLEQHLVHDNALRDGFLPKGSDVRDFSIVADPATGRHHIFYIDVRHGKSSRRPDNIHFIGHASTADFVSWTVHRPALFVVPGTWEGGHVTAPYVFPIRANKRFDELTGFRVRFVMVYVGLSSSITQSLGMAFSNDLLHWTRYEGNPIFQPAHCGWAEWSRSTLANCRDPHVLQHGGRYILYYTALMRNADTCVAAAESVNLEDWRDRGPVLARPVADTMPAMTESSCVQPIDDRFVLFYSQAGATRYCISTDPTRFDAADGNNVLVKGFWGLELLGRRGNRWLVAMFRAHTAQTPGSVFLGTIIWHNLKPSFRLAKDRRSVKDFLMGRRP